MLARMSSADLAQRKGFELMFVAAMAASSLAVERVDAAAKGLVGEQAEEALDLIDPGGGGGREVDMPAGPLGEPSISPEACRPSITQERTARRHGRSRSIH